MNPRKLAIFRLKAELRLMKIKMQMKKEAANATGNLRSPGR
jgi:hypothetical protein